MKKKIPRIIRIGLDLKSPGVGAGRHRRRELVSGATPSVVVRDVAAGRRPVSRWMLQDEDGRGGVALGYVFRGSGGRRCEPHRVQSHRRRRRRPHQSGAHRRQQRAPLQLLVPRNYPSSFSSLLSDINRECLMVFDY